MIASNIERRTSNGKTDMPFDFDVQRSAFDVRRSAAKRPRLSGEVPKDA